MSLETLTKDELLKILKDKQTVHDLTMQKKETTERFMFTDLELHALQNGRCRLCVGERFEVPDESSPVGKVLMHKGQPYLESKGGTQPACRTCQHIRRQLQVQGVRDVFI